MHTSFVKMYVLVFVLWTVEKSECKQGGHQAQQMNAADFNFYYGAACLSYGHSCWGAHGKRNAADLPNKLFMYLMRKSTDKQDPTVVEQNSSQQDEDMPSLYTVLRSYGMQRNAKKTNSRVHYNDYSMDDWNLQPSKYIPSGRYEDDQAPDSRREYDFTKI